MAEPQQIQEAIECGPADTQRRARSTSPLIEYEGETKTPAQWSRDARVSVSGTVIMQRLDYGWAVQDALLRPTQTGRGQTTRPLTEEEVAALRAYAGHYTENPAPAGLAALAASLLCDNVSLAAIRVIVDNQQAYTVQAWASQGGYIPPYLLNQHQMIRDAVAAGAVTYQEVGALLGKSRERVRQLALSMPDRAAIIEVLHANTPTGGNSTSRQRARRELTDQEATWLQNLYAAAAEPREGAMREVNRAVEQRDVYARKLYDAGVTTRSMAQACEVSLTRVQAWISPAKQYRRNLRKRGRRR